jgi:hypothetical protein
LGKGEFVSSSFTLWRELDGKSWVAAVPVTTTAGTSSTLRPFGEIISAVEVVPTAFDDGEGSLDFTGVLVGVLCSFDLLFSRGVLFGEICLNDLAPWVGVGAGETTTGKSLGFKVDSSAIAAVRSGASAASLFKSWLMTGGSTFFHANFAAAGAARAPALR